MRAHVCVATNAEIFSLLINFASALYLFSAGRFFLLFCRLQRMRMRMRMRIVTMDVTDMFQGKIQ